MTDDGTRKRAEEQVRAARAAARSVVGAGPGPTRIDQLAHLHLGETPPLPSAWSALSNGPLSSPNWLYLRDAIVLLGTHRGLTPEQTSACRKELGKEVAQVLADGSVAVRAIVPSTGREVRIDKGRWRQDWTIFIEASAILVEEGGRLEVSPMFVGPHDFKEIFELWGEIRKSEPTREHGQLQAQPAAAGRTSTASDALSPYLRLMLEVAADMNISPANQPKKAEVESALFAAWPNGLPNSKNLLSAMATLLREPDSQAGRAKG